MEEAQGEEGEPSWRTGVLRGIPHLSNVTYFPPKGKEHELHLRLRVPRLFLSELFHYCIYIFDSLRA